MEKGKLISTPCILCTGNAVVLVSFNPQAGIPVPIPSMRLLKAGPPVSWVPEAGTLWHIAAEVRPSQAAFGDASLCLRF